MNGGDDQESVSKGLKCLPELSLTVVPSISRYLIMFGVVV